MCHAGNLDAWDFDRAPLDMSPAPQRRPGLVTAFPSGVHQQSRFARQLTRRLSNIELMRTILTRLLRLWREPAARISSLDGRIAAEQRELRKRGCHPSR